MKRSAPLARKTPLAPGKPLTRKTPLRAKPPQARTGRAPTPTPVRAQKTREDVVRERERARERARTRTERDAAVRAQRARMSAMHRAGADPSEIGAQLGIPAATVIDHLRAMGVLTRSEADATDAVLTASQVTVRARSGMRCERCGCDLHSEGGQVHHRHPRKTGGTARRWINLPANLLHLCWRCHGEVEAGRADALAAGWLVPMGVRTSAEVPVLTVHGWVLLDDDGGRRSVPAPVV